MAEIEVSPIADDEVELWVELGNAVDPQLPSTVDGVQAGRRRERTLQHFLARLDGRGVGVGSCLEQGDMRHTDVAVAFLGVLLEARRRGVGTALYAAASTHARSLAKAQLQCDLWEDDADGVTFLEHRGFAEVERFARVRLSLAEARLPDREAPAGVEVVPLAECLQLAPQLFEIAKEAAADMPSADPIEFTFDDWAAWELERETLRHDLGRVALVGGEPIGFGTISVIGDSLEGWNSTTAVLRAWRRQGVATAIKRAQIEAARRVGLVGLTTFSERRNVGMRALNERLGYEALPDQLRLRGPLLGA